MPMGLSFRSMTMPRRFVLFLALLGLAFTGPVAAQGPSRCTGGFINPVTDVCWGCLFPLSVGSMKIWGSSRADTDNPEIGRAHV